MEHERWIYDSLRHNETSSQIEADNVQFSIVETKNYLINTDKIENSSPHPHYYETPEVQGISSTRYRN